MRSADSARHLVDLDLIRYIDAEGDAEERRLWDRHIAGCTTCREAASTLRADSDTVARWLALADFENGSGREETPHEAAATVIPIRAGGQDAAAGRGRARSAGGGAPWLKAAVITLLVAAPLAAVPAVRDWVAERVPVFRSEGPTLAPAVDARPGAAPAVIRFVPAPGSFMVVLDAAPDGGTLHVERSPGPEAVLEVTGGSPGSSPVVAARSLRIGNSAGSTASYHLSLPPQVDGVLVDIGGRQVRLDASSLDRSTTIPLVAPIEGR